MVAFNFRESVSVSVSLSDIASMTAQEWANTVNIIGFLLKFRMETEGGAIRKNKLKERKILRRYLKYVSNTYDLSLLARLYNRVGSHIGFSASATFWAPYFLKADLLLLLLWSWR